MGIDGGSDPGLLSVAARPQALVERVLDGLLQHFVFTLLKAGNRILPRSSC